MFDYYDTEAAHLAEIEESRYSPYDFNFYSIKEKCSFIREKSHHFDNSEVGKFVIIQDSRRNKKVVPFMYLVDRNKTKRMWWSPDAYYAMVFDKRTAAEFQASKYKYNNIRVKEITKAWTKV